MCGGGRMAIPLWAIPIFVGAELASAALKVPTHAIESTARAVGEVKSSTVRAVGEVHRQLDEETADYISKCIEEDPENPELRSQRAIMYFLDGNYIDAAEDAEVASYLTGGATVKNFTLLGIILDRWGKWNEAIVAFTKAIEIAEDSESSSSSIELEGFYSDISHTFNLHTFRVPTCCKVCGFLLIGFSHQGYNCTKCDLPVHKGCAKKANTNVECIKHEEKKKDDSTIHEFKEKSFLVPTFCKSCDKLLIGLFKQGMCCIHCGITVHKGHACIDKFVGKRCVLPTTTVSSSPPSSTGLLEVHTGPPDIDKNTLHSFIPKNYYQPTWCDRCKGLLLGIANQGDVCISCNINVHHTCAKAIAKLPCDLKRLSPKEEALRKTNPTHVTRQTRRTSNDTSLHPPSLAELYCNRGLSHYHNSEYEKGLEDLSKAIYICEKEAGEVIIQQQQEEEEKGKEKEEEKEEEEEEHFIEAKNIARNRAFEYVGNRGLCYFYLGRLEEALKDLTLCIEGAEEPSAQMYATRAFAFQLLGRDEEANRDREIAYFLDQRTPLEAFPYTLPIMCTAHVFSFLSSKELQDCRTISRVWQEIIDTTPQLREMCRRKSSDDELVKNFYGSCNNLTLGLLNRSW